MFSNSSKNLLEESRSSDFDIIWSSSSDEEDLRNFLKCPSKDFLAIDDSSQPPNGSSSIFSSESPIIGSYRHSNTPNNSSDEQSSPIIGKKRKIFVPSPDLFSSQSTNRIELTPSTSKSEINYEITSVNTQDIKCTEITTINVNTATTLYNPTVNPKSSITGQYFNLVEKHKKFVKGGFASKAVNILRQIKNDADIFKHEMYLIKHEPDAISSIDEDLFVKLKVMELFFEFGLIIAKENKTAIYFNNNYKRNISIGTVIWIYPPYILKKFKFYDEIISVYLNVSKFLIE